MHRSLFRDLREIGVGEATASEVSTLLNPERYVSRQDLMQAVAAIQKALAQHREETDRKLSFLEQALAQHGEETDRKLSSLEQAQARHQEKGNRELASVREKQFQDWRNTWEEIASCESKQSQNKEDVDRATNVTRIQWLCSLIMAMMLSFFGCGLLTFFWLALLDLLFP